MKMIDYNLLRGKITAMQSTEPKYAYNFLNNAQNPSTEWECIEDMIDSMEVHEAEPVKRGKWLQHGKPDDYFWCCSACKKWIIYAEHDLHKHHFCGNCGADMRGED